jgi:hypothetical protein
MMLQNIRALRITYISPFKEAPMNRLEIEQTASLLCA